MVKFHEEQTKVLEDRLEQWVEALPKGCRIFLENFFLTCRRYPIAVNFLNYLRDIKLYSATNRDIRESKYLLVRAFYDITDTREEDLVKILMDYLRR